MNAVHRPSRALRILRHSVVPVVVLLVCAPGAVLAQDRLRLREIEVPAGRPELWPAGDWRPLSAEGYRRLVDAFGGATKPRDVWIGQAEYAATLADDTLEGGSLIAQVRRLGDEARFLEIGPTDLAISDLHWADVPAGARQAVWGRTPDGETAIVVDRGGGTLHGRWTVRGERVGRGIHFDLQVPEGHANSLRLRLPADATLQSSCGFVSGLPTLDGDELREWRVDLGSRVRCRLTVVTGSAAPVQPVVLSEIETAGAAREDGLHFQAKVSMEVLHAPIRTVDVLIPRDLNVYSVTYGELPLAWNARPGTGKQKRLMMELPDPLVGKSPSLRIHAIAPIPAGRTWEVPRLSVEGAFFGTSQVHLDVEHPLELQDLQLHGSRQIATVVRGGQGASYSFEEFRPDARIVVRLGRPRLNLSAEVVTHLSAAPQEWTLNSEVHLKCVSGSTFSAAIAMPPGWDVTEVRASGNTAGRDLLNWDVRGPRGQSRVVLDFAESFDSGESTSIRILARRRTEPGFARETAILLPQPQRAQISEMVVGVTYPAAESLEVRYEEPFERIETARVAAQTADSSVWRSFETARRENRSVVLRATTPRQGTRITVERRSPAFGARAHVIVEFEGDRVTEHFAMEISPEREAVASVRVYCSPEGPEPAWRIAGDDENLVAARRLAADEHSRWGLPAGGELWEITPAQPQRDRFTIAGTRTRRIQAGSGVLLAVVPEGADFEGMVELKGVQGRLPELEARGPQRVEGNVVAGGGPFGSTQRWRYRSSTDSLQIASLPGSGVERTDRTARLHLRSRISAEGADLRHQARFETGRMRAPGRFRFELPPSCAVVRATIDGEPVSITREGPEYVLPVMRAERPHLVEVAYRSPAADGLLSAQQQVPVPASRFEILRFDWEFVLPEGIDLSVAPSEVRVHDPPVVASWSERLFGPLGRPQGRPAFNPLSARAWWELLFGPGRRERSGDRHVAHRASAPTSPDLLTFKTWNRTNGRTAGWIVFLATLFVGLALRLSRLRGRTWVASVWLAAALAAAWILPAGWAEIAGAAIAGALLAIVVPGPLIRTRGCVDRESPSIGSTETVSYRRAAPGSALVALVLLHAAGAGLAQEAEFATPGDSTEFSVLIPVEPKAASEPTVVFVSKELWERSLTMREDGHEYLISSAVYEAEIDSAESANIRATYRVAALGEAGSPRILLPITGAHLTGPDACRVNGTVHPVLPSPGGDGFVIAPALVPGEGMGDPSGQAPGEPVDAVADGHLPLAHRLPHVPVRWLEIELDLRAPVMPSQAGGRLEIGVPSVPSARVSLSLKRAYATVEVLAARGRKTVSAEGRRVTAELGGVSRLQVVWSSEDRVDQSAETEVSIATRIDAQPTRLQIRCRVSYQVNRGTIHSLVWEIPRELAPRTITLEGSETLTGWFLSPAGGHKLHLHIPLATPRTQDFIVDATFTLPARLDGEEIVVPPLDLLAPHPDHERMAYRHQVGIGSTPLYRIATPPTQSDALATLSAEAFFAEFSRGGSAAGVDRPRVAWRLQRPTELRFRLVPLEPQRRVWSPQTGHIGVSEILWTAAIELETNAAPAFRHRLLVSPLFQIDSISVHEDEVDRLARWSRNGDSVVLHLKDRTAGVQNVVVKGRMPLQPDGATPLPLVQVEGAEVVDSRLHLYRSPDAEIELLGTAELESLAGPPPRPADSTSLAVGQYRLPAGAAAPSVVVRRADGPPPIESLSMIRPRSDGSLEVRMLISPTQRGGPVRVALSPVLADLEVVQGRGGSYRLETGGNGESTLLITPDRSATGLPEVILAASISPILEGEWIVPVPSSNGLEQRAGFLVMAAGDLLTLDESNSRAVKPRAVPGWVAQAEVFRSAGPSARLYLTSAQEWRVRQSGPSPSTGPLISLLDTELWVSSAGLVYGTTQAVVPPLDEPVSIPFQWPEGVRLRSLAIEGEQARSIEPRPGVLQVLLDAAPVPQVVTIDWVGQAMTRWWPLTRTGVRMPVPQEDEVGIALVAVRVQGRPWLARQSVLGEAGRPGDHERIEGLLDACRAAETGLLGETAAFLQLSQLAHRLSQDGATANARPVREANRLVELVGEVTLGGGLQPSPQDTVDDAPLFAGRMDRLDAELMWWSVDRTAVSWGLLLAGAAVALPVATRFVRSRPSRWLQLRPAAALGILAVLWWACLRPSFLGLFILAAAAMLAWRGRSQERREQPASLQFD